MCDRPFEWLGVLTPSGIIIEANYPPSESLVGQPLWQVYPWNSASQAQLQNAIATAALGEEVFTYITLQKSSQTFELHLKPVQNEIGQLTVLILKGRNLTGDEFPPQPTRNQFDSFFEISVDLMAIVGSDGYFKKVNPAVETILGYTPEQCLAFAFIDLVHPDEQEITLGTLQQLASVKLSIIQLENRYRTQNGSYRQLSWHITPRAGLLYAIGRDITEIKQTESTLQENEALFRMIFEQAAIGLGHVALSGQFIQLNQRWCDLLSYSHQELLQLTFQDITHPDDLGADLKYVEQLIAGEISRYSMEKRYIDKYGSLVWVNLTVSLIREPSGEPKYFISAIEDISTRKQAETALNQYIQMLDFANDCIIVRNWDDRIIYWNQGAERCYGWKKEEVIGKYIHTFLQTRFPQDLEEIITTCLHQGTWFGELVHTLRDGTQITVFSRWTLQRDERGKPYALLEINNDISDRKQAEQELRLLLQKYSFMADTMPQIVWTADPDGFTDYYNQRWFDYTGMSLEETCGSGWQPILHPADLQHSMNCWNHAVATGENYQVEYRFKRASDGQYRWHLGRALPLRDENGTIVKWFGTCTDIDDFKRTEEALRQSEQEYRKLAGQAQLLNQLANQIRQSLDLNVILETVVTEIHSLLKIDRCMFILYRSECVPPVWEVVQESRDRSLPSMLGIYELEAFQPIAQKLLNLEIIQVDDVEKISDPLLYQFWKALGFTSVLNFPIELRSSKIGVVSCIHSKGLRLWDNDEVELLATVCDQLAIAINQAELYEKTCLAATEATEKNQQLQLTLQQLQRTQSQLIQSEKMSSLGQLVAGVAHEINNPVNFIFGNLTHAQEYSEQILGLLELYQRHYPQPTAEIASEIEDIDLEFLAEDLPKLLDSMKIGAVRIREIVSSLRTFSRLDEAEMKEVDIHEGIDSTLMILQNRIKAKYDHPAITVIKEYDNLPLVECYPGQLNQVFMNLLTNAIDALDDQQVRLSSETLKANPSTIKITTSLLQKEWVTISIADNGSGISKAAQQRLFDPFFTTKPVGKGTGLGLSISYQIIVEKHGGSLSCESELEKGTEFMIQIPVCQSL